MRGTPARTAAVCFPQSAALRSPDAGPRTRRYPACSESPFGRQPMAGAIWRAIVSSIAAL